MRVEARVAGRIFLPAAFPAEARAGLRARLTWPNKANVFDKTKPPFVVALDDTPSGCYVPRGAIASLNAEAEAVGVRLGFTDDRSDGVSIEVEHSLPDGGELHVHQARALRVFLRRQQGLVLFPCGGGKSALGLAAVGGLKRSALVLVHTQDLQDQWIEAARVQLGVGAVAVGSSLTREPPAVGVAMLQGLATRSGRALREWGRGFGVCVIDECHHAPAATVRRVVGCMAARYRLGLTATAERDDGLGGLIRAVIGPTLYAATVRDMVEVGRLVLPTVQRIETGRMYRGASNYSELLTAIARDTRRTLAIADVVKRDVGSGLRVLVLTLRVRHCEDLTASLRRLGLLAVAMHSGVAKRRRVEALAGFRAGETDVLVGTTVADEGLDIPAADSVHLVMPFRATGAAAQRTGRVIRAAAGKRPIVRDYVDEHPKARDYWAVRRRVYVDTYGEGVFTSPAPLWRRAAG